MGNKLECCCSTRDQDYEQVRAMKLEHDHNKFEKMDSESKIKELTLK